MLQVFKRNILADVPSGATVEAKGGKRFAKWTEGGRSRKAEVVTTRTGEKIITGESSVWYGKLRIGKTPHHHWKTVALFSDKTASERELPAHAKTGGPGAAGVVTVEMGTPQAVIGAHRRLPGGAEADRRVRRAPPDRHVDDEPARGAYWLVASEATLTPTACGKCWRN